MPSLHIVPSGKSTFPGQQPFKRLAKLNANFQQNLCTNLDVTVLHRGEIILTNVHTISERGESCDRLIQCLPSSPCEKTLKKFGTVLLITLRPRHKKCLANLCHAASLLLSYALHFFLERRGDPECKLSVFLHVQKMTPPKP
jgi:hypothetical protein